MRHPHVSVIIPALQKGDNLHELIELYNSHPRIDEILIINNSPTPMTGLPAKARVLQQEENIYVNEAWNLGAREAKCEYLLISNDDISIKKDLIDYGLKLLDWNLYDLVGPHRSSIDVTENFTRKHRPAFWMFPGFGALMFIRKSQYPEIPKGPKIWSGDDYIFWRQRRHPGTIIGFPVITEMGQTSSSPEFESLRQHDLEWFLNSGTMGSRWWHRTRGPLERFYAFNAAVKKKLGRA